MPEPTGLCGVEWCGARVGMIHDEEEVGVEWEKGQPGGRGSRRERERETDPPIPIVKPLS